MSPSIVNEIYTVFGIIVSALGGIAGIAALLLHFLEPKAKQVGTLLATAAIGELSRTIPPGLRSFVATELESLTSDPSANDLTVTAAAQHILAAAAPQFRGVVLDDVLTVLGDFTFAFASGINTGAAQLAKS